ncbi:MAG: hypothetical protein ACETWG_01920 [Candidatus Neomarinimicrobiota bacterium]
MAGTNSTGTSTNFGIITAAGYAAASGRERFRRIKLIHVDNCE